MTKTDAIYSGLIESIMATGEILPGRNGDTCRSFNLKRITFNSTPLVTVRKVAWAKAIREMEWFLSRDVKCPTELLDWWEGQLSPFGNYVGGYTHQLRSSRFDQIGHLIEGIKAHPFSRRHVITTWNPVDMYSITTLNNNPKTPTTCHTTIAQFFVSKGGYVSMSSYQRSADMIIGVPHNWIQSWALLLWVAAQVEGIPNTMIWTFGDAHIYQEPSHLSVVSQIRSIYPTNHVAKPAPRLLYKGAVNEFRASDFEMVGNIPSPVITTKPKLL